MVLILNLNSLRARAAFLLAALCLFALLAYVILSRFLVGTLTDDRVIADRNALASTVGYFPGSPRLRAALAEAEMRGKDRDLARAEANAARAIDLSPYDHRNRLLLAAIKEAAGDRAAAETALREALKLAPSHSEVHWRLANLLLRQGRLADSLEEFRIAVDSSRDLLPATLDLIWRASGRDVEAVKKVSPADPKSNLALARFLLKESAVKEAANIFGALDRRDRLVEGESAAFLDLLVGAGDYETAKSLWVDLKGGAQSVGRLDSIWNGGFEMEILRDFSQFDWMLKPGEYARLAIDPSVARSGSRSLKVEFTGRDTTRLDGEVRQLVLLRPGARYRLDCYAKTAGLVTPEGPRLALIDGRSLAPVGSSEPIAEGSSDWRHVALEFVAPASKGRAVSPVYISIERRPRFSYDDPTRGVLWLDDLSLTRLSP